MNSKNKTNFNLDSKTIEVLKNIISNLDLLVQQASQASQEVDKEKEKGGKDKNEIHCNVRLSNQKKKQVETEFVKTLTITWKDDKKYTEFVRYGLTESKLRKLIETVNRLN